MKTLKAFVAFAAVGLLAGSAHAAPPGIPGDHCAGSIANNAAAAGVCGPVCEKTGLQFAGNWSNDRNHPPVQSCIASGKGQSVCGCAAPTPGDRCSPQIADNAAAAGVCGPVCEKAGLLFAGNWSNVPSHPPVKACIEKNAGKAVCGCGAKTGDRCAPQIANNAAAAGVCGPVCGNAGLQFAGNWSNDSQHPPVQSCISRGEGAAVCGCGAPTTTPSSMSCVCTATACGNNAIGGDQGDIFANVSAENVKQKFQTNPDTGWTCVVPAKTRGTGGPLGCYCKGSCGAGGIGADPNYFDLGLSQETVAKSYGGGKPGNQTGWLCGNYRGEIK